METDAESIGGDRDPSRRDFLAGLVGALVSMRPTLASAEQDLDRAGSATSLGPPPAQRALPLAAWRWGDAAHEKFAAGIAGTPGLRLPERPHHLTRDPRARSRVFVVSRRPGEWLWVGDLERGCIVNAIAVDDSRRFEGHASWVYSGDGALRLLTTETDTDRGAGLVVNRDPDSLEVLDEWQTGGLGPHELLHWSGRGVVVANGGILTLPETGRENRMPGRLQSTLALLDGRHGRPLESWSLPDPSPSIRHLARARDGTLGLALQQWPEADGGEFLPVFALLGPEARSLCYASDGGRPHARWRGYAGAVAALGDEFAVTCPRADRVAIWRCDGSLTGDVGIPGAWGIAAHASGWWIGGAAGVIYSLDAATKTVSAVYKSTNASWDNHLTA